MVIRDGNVLVKLSLEILVSDYNQCFNDLDKQFLLFSIWGRCSGWICIPSPSSEVFPTCCDGVLIQLKRCYLTLANDCVNSLQVFSFWHEVTFNALQNVFEFFIKRYVDLWSCTCTDALMWSLSSLSFFLNSITNTVLGSGWILIGIRGVTLVRLNYKFD